MAGRTSSFESLEDAVAAYCSTVDELYGLYIDCTLGFRTLAERLAQIQRQSPGVPADRDPDSSTLFMGRGRPGESNNVLQHKTTIGEFKRRNTEGGENWIRLGQLLIVLLIEYWETEYRARVAAALGLAKPQDLKVKLLGDLRLLRHEVLHHQAVIRSSAVRKLEILKDLMPEEPLVLSAADIERIVRGIKSEMDEIVRGATGTDPKHSTVRSVR
jgi:hypothetical protein